MRKIKGDLKEEDFNFENDIFIFSYAGANIQSNFIKNLIEQELNKPFDTISKDDSKAITELLLRLNVVKKLYSIMGLLENYDLSTEKPTTITIAIEKVLSDKRLKKYRNLIYAIIDLKLSTIENFEKEYNITILIEE